MSKLTNLIDEILLIPNLKFADPAMFLSNYTEVSNYGNTFSWPILPVD